MDLAAAPCEFAFKRKTQSRRTSLSRTESKLTCKMHVTFESWKQI
jgi:hypothetical protein